MNTSSTSKESQVAAPGRASTSAVPLSSLWRTHPRPQDVELAQVGAGFLDPFDELASAHVLPPGSDQPHSSCCHQAESTSDPLGHPLGGGDPLGASQLGQKETQSNTVQRPHASSSSAQPDLWPWAAFEDDVKNAGQNCGAQQLPRGNEGHGSRTHGQQQQTTGTSPQGDHHIQSGADDGHDHHQQPVLSSRRSLQTTSEGWVQGPFEGEEGVTGGSGNSRPILWCSANQTMQRVHSTGDLAQGSGATGAVDAQQEEGGVQGQGEAFLRHRSQTGAAEDVRELFIYAIPLTKERLVFLPVAGWTENPKQEQEGIRGLVSSGATNLRERIIKYWQRMGTKDPDTFQHKVYSHGKSVLENMSAEERLMRNIPKTATKVVVYHPATVMPSTVQEQLTNMTSTYCIRSAGKAAAAGILLPVAVGIECIAVPGAGWFTLYQLYKASVGSQGGNRLRGYLNHDDNVRVCYAGDERLNKYVERLKLCPDGILTQDDVDDLCHELGEPQLLHPLSELRNRYLKRLRHKGEGDYALLPATDAAGDDDEDPPPPAPPPKRGWFW
mmetsp:Transcript_21373/g.59240  ORF Transcript_21373/g.59240 Transcript_21373/m.59240 type:complete len:554 (+) Transcript_21373:158-1819(+)|eukprot:CAMPEP_0202350944 /NCGR_PEP_ID=MMETSP1126-20121109/7802_1 /ASSEMBLY_ACC=CAM_ASM_000457 /TAXON_ID=3047 /ORGANISM="Dunaliella tertiolecta, Strain CCMP1320" /LENGTH=553 /DNA_ID=CAMNT_0048942993 /DNA_START=86 /DNA_END=1748 /DNA_ORIENTATION=-